MSVTRSWSRDSQRLTFHCERRPPFSLASLRAASLSLPAVLVDIAIDAAYYEITGVAETSDVEEM